MNKPTLKLNRRVVGLLVLLAVVAAAAAGYTLFFSPMSTSVDKGEKIAAIKAKPTQQKVKPKLNQKISVEAKEENEVEKTSAAEPVKPAAPSLEAVPVPSDSKPIEPNGDAAKVQEPAETAFPKPVSAQAVPEKQPKTEKTASVVPESSQTSPTKAEPTAAEEKSQPAPEKNLSKPQQAPAQIEEKKPENKKTASAASKNKQAPWVINALSTKSKKEAEHYLKLFSQTTYTVYSYEINLKGENWHRIRLGFFSSKRMAEEIGEALAKEYKLPPPWIVKPKSSEIQKYRNE